MKNRLQLAKFFFLSWTLLKTYSTFFIIRQRAVYVSIWIVYVITQMVRLFIEQSIFSSQEKKLKITINYTRILSIVEQSCISVILRRGGIGNGSSSTQLGAVGEHLHSRNPVAGTPCTPTCTSDISWGKCRCWKYHLTALFLQSYNNSVHLSWTKNKLPSPKLAVI